jgi:microfibrillar-associated protein 1
MEQELFEQEAREKEIAMERKTDSMSLVTRVVKRELEEEATKDLKEVSQVDDSDNIDPEAEYQAWTLRELKRIKRDRLEMEEQVFEISYIRNISKH